MQSLHRMPVLPIVPSMFTSAGRSAAPALPPMDIRRVIGYTLSELTGFGTLAVLFYYLNFSGASNVADVWAVDRVIAYVLMFMAPLLIFLPVCLAFHLGPTWLLGAGSWALLGYVLIFVPSPERSTTSLFTYTVFLTLVFVALASVLALPMGALSNRFLPPTPAPWVRALRQGSLIALFVVSAMAMSPLGVLNWLNIMLVFTIVALAEFFFLARS